MEQLRQEQNFVAGEQSPAPSSHPLEQKHSDRDILEGCPRSLVVNNIEVKKRAYTNNEFSLMAMIVTHLGFNTCETEEEITTLSLEEIYNNAAINFPQIANYVNAASLEDFLYDQMAFDEKSPELLFDEITHEDFVKFFGIIIEQNNLIKSARANAKKKIRTEAAAKK
jgi:hypothetical protein